VKNKAFEMLINSVVLHPTQFTLNISTFKTIISHSIAMHTSYHCTNTEKLKLLTLFWSMLEWLFENILQQSSEVTYSEQGSDNL